MSKHKQVLSSCHLEHTNCADAVLKPTPQTNGTVSCVISYKAVQLPHYSYSLALNTTAETIPHYRLNITMICSVGHYQTLHPQCYGLV